VGDKSMKINGTDAKYGDWRDDLARDRYAVVKGAEPSQTKGQSGRLFRPNRRRVQSCDFKTYKGSMALQ
jgi:hypothetical protein